MIDSSMKYFLIILGIIILGYFFFPKFLGKKSRRKRKKCELKLVVCLVILAFIILILYNYLKEMKYRKKEDRIATGEAIGVEGFGESCPNAFSISPGALCRGGPYMWQGDSKRAKMCKDMASTDEGRCQMSKFNCPIGYNGMPSVPIEFTSNSDSSWSGVRCKGCGVDHAYYNDLNEKQRKHRPCGGMCSMWIN